MHSIGIHPDEGGIENLGVDARWHGVVMKLERDAAL